MRKIGLLFLFSFISLSLLNPNQANSQDVENGKNLFEQNCTSCHKLGEELIGPNLIGVNDRKSKEWLHRFIKNSQKVINSGDEYAQNLYNEYNQTVMPAQNLDTGEINDILAYIEEEGSEPATASGSGEGTAKESGSQSLTGMTSIAQDPTFQGLAFLVFLLLILVLITATNLFTRVLEMNNSLPRVNWQRVNIVLMVIFFVGGVIAIVYEMNIHTQYLMPEAASEHGKEIDQLFNITLIITGLVFIITQVLLFYFAFAYKRKKGTKALFYPVNNRLELFWTAIPAIALTVLILYGAKTWRDIHQPADEDAQKVEIYGYQFNWKFRYPGPDGELGKTDFKLTSAAENPLALDPKDPAAKDDIITNELRLPVDKEVKLLFRSRDVIHSAWLPHFRAQMYCQPGMRTQFKLTPTKTTEEMREQEGEPEFDYELACNQVCGAAHYNMKATVVIQEESKFRDWLAEKEPFKKDEQNVANADVK